MLQINEKVWRGFYSPAKLSWDITYNARAGSEILFKFMVNYALKQQEHQQGGDLSNLARATYFVQGFGNVGSWAARLLNVHDARLIAVEDASGAIYDPDGLDPEELTSHLASNTGVASFGRGKAVDHETFFSTEADIFIPAALENQITEETAPLLNVRLVAEGANGPTTPEGDAVLEEKGIQLLPDVLCNAGGVTVSYFEWAQNIQQFRWELDRINDELSKIMRRAYAAVSATAYRLSRKPAMPKKDRRASAEL